MLVRLVWWCVCLLLVCDDTLGAEDSAHVDGVDSYKRAKSLQQLLLNKLNLVDSNPFPSDFIKKPSTPGDVRTPRPVASPTAADTTRRRGEFKTVTVLLRHPTTPPQPAPTPSTQDITLPKRVFTPSEHVFIPERVPPAAPPQEAARGPLPRSNMDKLMAFLDENQHRVRDFMRTVKSDLSVPPMEVTPPPSLFPELRAGLRGPPRAPFRDPHQPPVGLQLDMSPAKGGRVHILRMKNRLCHRHVLVPEGPKYDSVGHVYLGAHAGGAGVQFPATRRPRLLLPRCCNCCKKSLLGCE